MYRAGAALFLLVASAAPGRALENKGYMPYDSVVNESVGLYPVSDKDIYFKVYVSNVYEQRKGSYVHAGYSTTIVPLICYERPRSELGVYRVEASKTAPDGCMSTDFRIWVNNNRPYGDPVSGWLRFPYQSDTQYESTSLQVQSDDTVDIKYHYAVLSTNVSSNQSGYRWLGVRLGKVRQPSHGERSQIYQPFNPIAATFPGKREPKLTGWFPASINGSIYYKKSNNKLSELLITDRPYPEEVVISGDWRSELKFLSASPRQEQRQAAPPSPGGPRSIRGTQPASADVPSVFKQISNTFMRR